MKKSILFKQLLFVMSFMFILTSCSKETNFEKRLDGSWLIAKWSSQAYEDGTEVYNSEVENFGTMTFERDGTGIANVLGFTEAFTWTATSTHITLDFADDDPEEYEIIKNEKAEQIWKMDITYTEDGVEHREVETVTLKKQ